MKNHGFTLIEMIVSLAIFSVVAVVALGALIKVISANQKAQSIQSVVSNLNFVLESMSRELRTGSAFHCDTGSLSSYDGASLTLQGCSIIHLSSADSGEIDIAFKSSRAGVDANGVNPCNLANVYQFSTSGLGGEGVHVKKVEQTTCGVANAVTGTDVDNSIDIVDVTNMNITDVWLGVGPYDGSSPPTFIPVTAPYPRIFIRLAGFAGPVLTANAGASEKVRTYFDVQTTISGRVSI